jgi:hypothetical protein
MPFPVKPCMMKSSSSTEGNVLGAQMRNAFMDLERWWRNDKRNTKIAWPSRTSQLWPRAPGWPGYRSNLLGDHERDLPRLVPRDEFSGSHGKARKRKYSRVPQMPYMCIGRSSNTRGIYGDAKGERRQQRSAVGSQVWETSVDKGSES